MTFTGIIRLQSDGGQPTFFEITQAVAGAVRQSGIENGLCVVYTHHTTCTVLTQERSLDVAYNGLEFLQQDLLDILESIMPPCRREGRYLHPGPQATAFAAEHGEDKPEALNTDGHLQSSILGRSESLAVLGGELDLGKNGRLYFVDLDRTRPRERQVTVQIIGESHRL